jgi:hypothetical protein
VSNQAELQNAPDLANVFCVVNAGLWFGTGAFARRNQWQRTGRGKPFDAL